MIERRLRAEQTEFILGRWSRAGHDAYLGLYEVTGRSGVPLKRLIGAAQIAINRGFGGATWNRSAVALGVGGQIKTFAVTQTASGEWILRRWVILGTARPLDNEIADLASSIRGRWERSLSKSGDVGRLRAEGFQWINPRGEVPAIASLVNGAPPPADARGEMFSESLRIAFSVDSATEISPGVLAERFRRNSAPIREMFADIDGTTDDLRIGLALRHDDDTGYRFGIAIHERETFTTKKGIVLKRPKKVGEFLRILLPEGCKPFVEYATALESVRTWSANPARTTGSSEWNELLEAAGRLKPKYAYLPPSKGPKSAKK